jgi:hypothetical protein
MTTTGNRRPSPRPAARPQPNTGAVSRPAPGTVDRVHTGQRRQPHHSATVAVRRTASPATSPRARRPVGKPRRLLPLLLIGLAVVGFTGLFLASAYLTQPLTDWLTAHWAELCGGLIALTAIVAICGKQIVHHCPGCRHH